MKSFAFFLIGVLCGILALMIIRNTTLIICEPNTGQPGYQISYRTWYGDIKYYYPVTEYGKTRVFKVMGWREE